VLLLLLNRVENAGKALRKEDIAAAKRTVDAALNADPKP
jgi:hypothetical protein